MRWGRFPVIHPVGGAVRAANELGIEVVLVGHRLKSRTDSKHAHSANKVRIVHCEEMVEMHESPVKHCVKRRILQFVLRWICTSVES